MPGDPFVDGAVGGALTGAGAGGIFAGRPPRRRAPGTGTRGAAGRALAGRRR